MIGPSPVYGALLEKMVKASLQEPDASLYNAIYPLMFHAHMSMTAIRRVCCCGRVFPCRKDNYEAFWVNKDSDVKSLQARGSFHGVCLQHVHDKLASDTL